MTIMTGQQYVSKGISDCKMQVVAIDGESLWLKNLANDAHFTYTKTNLLEFYNLVKPERWRNVFQRISNADGNSAGSFIGGGVYPSAKEANAAGLRVLDDNLRFLTTFQEVVN